MTLARIILASLCSSLLPYAGEGRNVHTHALLCARVCVCVVCCLRFRIIFSRRCFIVQCCLCVGVLFCVCARICVFEFVSVLCCVVHRVTLWVSLCVVWCMRG